MALRTSILFIHDVEEVTVDRRECMVDDAPFTMVHALLTDGESYQVKIPGHPVDVSHTKETLAPAPCLRVTLKNDQKGSCTFHFYGPVAEADVEVDF